MLISHDLKNDSRVLDKFDFVVCASGHFSTPNVPTFKGLDNLAEYFMPMTLEML